MKQITPAAVVVLAIGAISVSAQSLGLKAPQRLSVAVDGPAKPVAPGEHFALSVRIVPNPGIHVYAPGNPDNIPVSISVTPPAGLTAEPAKFPKPEDFFFGPTAETLKVFTKPFVVSVPMSVESGAAAKTAGEAIVTGTVRYQACNDRVCFPPQSAPFEARVALSSERH